MGEHRFSIKIEFEMHGHKDKWDAWLNFSERDVPHIDHRVVEWLQEQHMRAMDNWFDAEADEATRRKAEIENSERKELERLKAKYETK